MNSPSSAMGELLSTTLRELWRRRLLIGIVFAVVALLVLSIGLMLPKKYVSETTVLALEQNIVNELTAGVAVATGLHDRASMVRDVIFSRKLMLQVLDAGGWMESDPSPVEQDRLIKAIIARTTIAGSKDNLIRISYNDRDPQRAFTVVQRMAELFIAEVREGKARESRDAFRFIDSQVQAYQQKLVEVERRMTAYREKNPEFMVGSEKESSERMTDLRRQVESGKLELAQLKSVESALAGQLAGTPESISTTTRSPYRSNVADPRVVELQNELARALTSYTEQHPDVVRLRAQLREAQALGGAAAGGGISSISQGNPVHAQLRSRLIDVRSQIAGLQSRIDAGGVMLQSEFQRGQNKQGTDLAGMELSADYQVYRELYQKLLARRESARVSMNLDAEQSGVGFRIHEPALFPLQSVGVRLLHVAMGGLLLAILLPIGAVAGWTQIDGKLRSAGALERSLGFPVMASIPAYRTTNDRGGERSRNALLVAIVVGVLMIYAILFALRQWGLM